MVQDHERLQIGRELHDSTGQLLLALRLGIAQLKRLGHDAPSDAVLMDVEGMLGRMDAEIRSISFLNYPAELRNGDLEGSMRSLVKGFAGRTGMEARLDIGIGLSVPPGWAGGLALLRVAQESLMNIHRHAQATAVNVHLFAKDGWIELRVRDNGVGIDLSRGDTRRLGVGMSGMRHRVESLGGRFAVRRLRKGTQVEAALQRAPFQVPSSNLGCPPAG
ncbi:MAG TPA: ATP-binding protein [Sphingomicrobium sp.]|nr:ATP-binding protein [Sphingomicrobium sp.]